MAGGLVISLMAVQEEMAVVVLARGEIMAMDLMTIGSGACKSYLVFTFWINLFFFCLALTVLTYSSSFLS